jgi:hypothetical protein
MTEWQYGTRFMYTRLPHSVSSRPFETRMLKTQVQCVLGFGFCCGYSNVQRTDSISENVRERQMHTSGRRTTASWVLTAASHCSPTQTTADEHKTNFSTHSKHYALAASCWQLTRRSWVVRGRIAGPRPPCAKASATPRRRRPSRRPNLDDSNEIHASSRPPTPGLRTRRSQCRWILVELHVRVQQRSVADLVRHENECKTNNTNDWVRLRRETCTRQ